MHLAALKNINLKFFMDKDFIELRNSVDNLMKQKAQNGIGTKVNKADKSSGRRTVME